MVKISEEIVKIFIRTEIHYIFSRKKAYGKKSDGLLELIGGHVEDGETPFEALQREAREEEETGILANLLVEKQLTPINVNVEVDGLSEQHFVYILNITEEDSRKLKASSDESYGLEFIENSFIETSEGLSKLRSDITWKTNEIFIALRKEDSNWLRQFI
ncbi:NUDIX domain-containing protein [Desulforhopalus singaporensis]|uniref:NUDIX domain-containing protein n=1 Tax=Desulforhopalus singaporensis TaxID=91360 RepID=A0A1H0SQM7_9BACT|nr:NUDIX hydrolase [Desulforhopalus singaporensis]SDP43496.1 NUDIX domain-containing protein [Desulforhopalus singaporensis]